MTALTDLPNASLRRRFAAWIYDLFLLFAVAFAYSAAATIVLVSLGIEASNLSVEQRGDDMTLIDSSSGDFQPFLRGPLFQLGLAMVLMAFYIVFWIKRGATLGMQTWRLELIDLNGNRPNLKTCVLRCVLAIVSFGMGGLGYFWLLFDPDKQTFHDRVTKTRVIVHPKN